MTLIVTVQDFASPSSFVCERGRVWFRKHGLDWADFKRNGIDIELLRATGDHLDMVAKVEKTALKRIGRE